MGALRFIGFLLIAAIVVAGLDYYQQDKKHDGTLSFGSYIDTINDRFGVFQAEKVAKQTERERKKSWDAGAKSYLPTPPEGWARYDLTDTQSKPVQKALSELELSPLISSISSQEELFRLTNEGRDGLIRKLARSGYVYEKDGEIAWFDITLKPKKARNTMVGLALGRQADVMNAMEVSDGFAVIDGVAFAEVTGGLSGGVQESDIRKIKGRIGFDEEVVLRLHTNGNDATIRQFLKTVDLAGLNALLEFPSVATGQDIYVPLKEQPEMADKMLTLYGKMIAMQDKVTQQKIENMDIGAMMLNTLTATDFNAEGLADITGGKVFENQDNLQMAYGKALEMILLSDQRQADAEPSGSGGGLIKGFLQKLPVFGALSGGGEVASAANAGGSNVRVRKGSESSSCAVTGRTKRCTFGKN
ncbi:hypothetical protein SAMN05444358_10825 [Ruegeria halocynthiae]|uniref:Uncharacterized protein n=1 Tax=Ruegeria halocynthiae TaxID=985054 RepID=A0A1H3D8S9_9RHOB|nr:hypothetical protein [Ruegeria halocynthiae]SDX62863.1 hypothetical protein SAMN05444358_10825 [Ruegeria halocynthiae]